MLQRRSCICESEQEDQDDTEFEGEHVAVRSNDLDVSLDLEQVLPRLLQDEKGLEVFGSLARRSGLSRGG